MKIPAAIRTALITFFLASAGTLFSQTFNEILGRPEAHAVTISVMFDAAAEVYWELGTTSGAYPTVTGTQQAGAAVPLEFALQGLTPDTRYFYRTRYRPAGTAGTFKAGPERTFHTQRSPGSTFTFTLEADEHLYDKKGSDTLYRICLANQLIDQPDFMLSLGDIFGDDHYPLVITSEQMKTLHRNYRPFLGAVCHSVPLFICLGNHEGEKDYYLAMNPPENIAVYATKWRKFYFPNPEPDDFYSGNTTEEPWGIGLPHNYYAWTWGDALFVVLDAYRDQCDTSAKPKNWAWSLGQAQYDWLRTTLENSTAKYKLVFAHHTRGEGRGGAATARYFEWGGYNADGTTWGFGENRPGWPKPIHQLFVDNGVNVFFQGHDHLFSREMLDGVTYQEAPMPSDSTYRLGIIANGDAYLSDTVEGSGHLRVTVSPSCIRVDFVRAYLPADTLAGTHRNGEIAFSYTVGGCPSGTDEPQVKDDFIVYPNPAGGELNIRRRTGGREFQAELVNLLGRTLASSCTGVIDVSPLPDGFYFLDIRSGATFVRKKIVVAHQTVNQ